MHRSLNIVEQIAAFTAQREIDMLELSLLKSINNMLSADKVSIVSMDRHDKIRTQKVFAKETCLVVHHSFNLEPRILQAFKDMHTPARNEYNLVIGSNFITVLVLQSSKDQQKYLVLEQSQHIEKAEMFVMSGILGIYKNFIEVLNESQTDELTGLNNRKTFDAAIKRLINSLPSANDAKRRSSDDEDGDNPMQYWLAIVDIDHFKSINDNFGHLYGDEILIQVANLIGNSFRNDDLQFRFGGEEFIILLKAPDIETCRQILDRFRDKIATNQFPAIGKVTVSIGVVALSKEIFYVTLIDYADQALYHSKKNGRNRITFFEDMLQHGLTNITKIEGGDVELF